MLSLDRVLCYLAFVTPVAQAGSIPTADPNLVACLVAGHGVKSSLTPH
jgi:hypothetical protein